MHLAVLFALVGIGYTPPDRLSADTVRPIVQQLASEDVQRRLRAERTLLAMGPDAIGPLLEVLSHGNLAEMIPIQEVLPKYGPGAIGALCKAGLRDFRGGRPETMWKEAIGAVARMGDSAVPRVMEIFLTEERYGECWFFAAQVIGVLQMQDRRMTPLLIPLLRSPRAEVRREAATLLQYYPDPRAADALLEVLQSENRDLKDSAMMALASLKDRRASDTILSLTYDGESAMREYAAIALGALYEPRFRSRLASMARNEGETRVRDVAATALLRTNDPIAKRLGARYQPFNIDPVAQRAVFLTYAILCAGTGVLLALACGLASWLVAKSQKGAWPMTSLVGVVTTIGGFVWGRVITHMTGAVEDLVLLGVVPGVVLFGALISLSRRPSAGPSFRRVWFVGGAGSFYLGYFVGWLWLWGYLRS